jgi:hypothetical protein
MTTLSHGSLHAGPERTPMVERLGPEVWPSLAIAVVWLAVLFDAIFGPDIVTNNGAGTNTSTVPSAVAVAFFAFLTSWVVAHYAFRRGTKE